MQPESHTHSANGTDYGTKEPKSREKPRPLDAEVGPMGLAASTVLGTSEIRSSEAKGSSYR